MALNLPRASILFRSLGQSVSNRTKSTFVYEVDKTSSQKWIKSRTDKLRENQKIWAAEDGSPIWWKTKADKIIVTFVVASTIGSTIGTLINLTRYSMGKL